jgi:3-hydroxybutyrate dehydrogenase
MKLDEKVAIVTGAASGIVKEVARTFAREGAHVVIADLNLQQAQAAAEEIGSTGPKVMAVAIDVTDEQGVNSGVDVAVSKVGTIDVLVATPAFRSCTRSRNSLLANGKGCSPFTSTVPS